MYTLKEWSIYFPQSCGSPESKPHWSSKPNILRAHLPSAGPLGWGALCEVQTSQFLGRISAIVVILPFVGHLPGSISLDYTIALSVLSHLTVVPSLYLYL